MINFQYARANDVVDAVRQIAGDPNAKFVAGGIIRLLATILHRERVGFTSYESMARLDF